ncbi:metallophosphoesterase [Parathalassolituus penaei]|uniref:Metallophosphoesterase n=1 Tax=Parathalassolituus penaei TaxID=2997323 RepID=A0A9X3EG08_9GAMM|nr:metallophosphoesterase [Parathalassolituus penaei]MCY0966933.1 metallophosphoesterase [Parathalassolituus penaei]
MKIKPRVLRLPVNESGRDFVVGDIHGHVSRLFKQLEGMGFDRNQDRLICVGDLIDRGPESQQALALLNEPWFFSVLGNHEYLMVNALRYGNSEHKMLWLTNGGEWIASTRKDQWEGWFNQIEELPLAIEVSNRNGVRYGIIHAEFPADHWSQLETLDDKQTQAAIWSRGQFKARSEHVVPGIDVVIHGHNVSDGELHLGNRFYIEPGAFKGNDFIIKVL